MAFAQYILEMKVLVTEALRNTVDCRCSSETLEPSPCPSGQTTTEILQLKLYSSEKQIIWNSTAWQKITEI